MLKGAVGFGMVLAALAAAPAVAADELSETQRLQDRREVAAGTRAQVLGFQNGHFYANGWHTTGEMGGIITPPLKLLDSVSFGVNGDWVGEATRFFAGQGYTRYELPSVDGLRLRRIDVAPDGVRGALLGLTISNPGHRKRTATVMVDAHSELMTQYPWGFGGTVPNASDNAQDTGVGRPRHARVPRHRADPGRGRARTPTPRSSAPTGGRAAARPARATTAPFGAGRVCSRRPDRPDAVAVRRRPVRPRHRRAAALRGRRQAATGARRCGSPSPARRTRAARRARRSPS